jgi:hypothetical protein
VERREKELQERRKELQEKRRLNQAVEDKVGHHTKVQSLQIQTLCIRRGRRRHLVASIKKYMVPSPFIVGFF